MLLQQKGNHFMAEELQKDTITVSYQLTLADVLAERPTYDNSKAARVSNFYWYRFLPVLLAGLAVATSFGTAGVFGCLFVGGLLAVNHWDTKLVTQACFSSDNLSVRTLPRTATVAEEGLCLESDAGYTVYRWGFIRNVCRSGAYVRFTITPIELIHIPVSAFEDDAHRDAFLNYAREHIRSTDPAQHQ